MRKGVIKEVHKMMSENENIYFLTGDLGYNTLEKIEQDFPKRFINVGVAEQNMIGIASGLAMTGKKVFVYSIIPFVTMRCFEQIRNDMCYHDLDVTILGIGAGLSYGILSNTHFALEDVAILRSLPNMTIFSPADETEAVLGVKELRDFHHPLYFRIGKKQEPVIFNEPYNFKFGKGKIVNEGKDVVIFASGPIISEAIKAGGELEKKNIKTTLIDIHTIKPIDTELIIEKSKNKKLIVTLEEHYLIGGLSSAISEVVAQNNIKLKIVCFGVDDQFVKIIGAQSHLRSALKLDSLSIASRILREI